MNRTITFIAGCLLALASLVAQAQAPAVQLTMDTGFYIGAGGGRVRGGEGCLGTCDTSDKSWQLFAGYQFNRHLALEVGYSDFGEITTSGTLAGAPVTMLINSTVWEFVGVGLLPMTDNFAFYAKVGIFRFDADATISGAVVGTSSDSGAGFTAGAGIQYAFARHFAARIEWQRYADISAGVPGAQKEDFSVWRLAARYKF